jgi:hypothetical protein
MSEILTNSALRGFKNTPGNQAKRKPPCGGFLRFEDAKVGLLVAFF